MYFEELIPARCCVAPDIPTATYRFGAIIFPDESVKVFNEFASIRDSYRNQTNPQQFNYETLDLFLKHKLITIESVKKLDERGKLKIDKDKIETLIDKYEGE
jgi:hypothetical protein